MSDFKEKVASFFDNCAPWWDSDMIRNEAVIEKILKNGGVKEGSEVLDIATGTGVLFEDYIKNKVGSITGIDISTEMVRLAREKYPEYEIICGDAEEYDFKKQFDCIMIYNAFPHFENPKKLIANLSQYLKKGGRLSVAHGMSEEALQKHHERARDVSFPLLSKESLAELMGKHLKVEIMISDKDMYQVVGIKVT